MTTTLKSRSRRRRAYATLLRWATGGLGLLLAVLALLLWLDGRREMPKRSTGTAHQNTPTAAPPTTQTRATPIPTKASAPRAPSRCFGTVSDGRVEGAWQLPAQGDNFQVYSGLGWQLGRTYVHSTVHEVVLASYRALYQTHPELQFVYGETGLAEGGRFRPHRTHRSGTSVDFVSPVRRKDTGEPAVLPTSPNNKWGYAIDFDADGGWGDYVLDFEAIALHLAELRDAAAARGVQLTKVVLYPPLRRKLVSTKAWPRISNIPFTTREAWVRHDDHYHVDFGVACEPLQR